VNTVSKCNGILKKSKKQNEQLASSKTPEFQNPIVLFALLIFQVSFSTVLVAASFATGMGGGSAA
jgi:hypothetical protein